MEKIKILTPEELGTSVDMTATEIKSAIENDTIVYVYCWDDDQQGFVLYYPNFYDNDNSEYRFYDLLDTSAIYFVNSNGVFSFDDDHIE